MKRPSIATILYRHAHNKEEKRFTQNKDGWLNVTDLWNSCMRQVYLANLNKIPVVSLVDPVTRMRFEMGIALEIVVKGWLAELDIIELSHDSVRNTDLRIIGHEDVRFKNGLIGEIKCQAPEIFRICQRFPLRYHQFQVETYLEFDKQYAEGVLASFTYGTNEKNPFRDQTVRFNVKVGELLKQTVGPLREAEAGGLLPDRVCASANDLRARVCPVRDQCFSLPSRGLVKTIKEIYEAGFGNSTKNKTER